MSRRTNCRDCDAEIMFVSYTNRFSEVKKMPVDPVAVKGMPDGINRVITKDGRDVRNALRCYDLMCYVPHYLTCQAPAAVKFREKIARGRR